MRWRKAPQIRRNLAKAVPKAFVSAAQASFAAFILYALTLSPSNPIQENRNQVGHNMQDEGPLPSSFMTTMQSRSPLLCSAGHCGGKGPPDLNFTRCRYFLAALRDSMAPFDPLALPTAVPAPPRFMRSGNQSVHMSSIICNVRTICHIVWTVFAINIMFILARLLCLLRFVYPRKVFRDSISFLTTLTNFALQCLPRSWFDFCVYNPLLGSVQWKWQGWRISCRFPTYCKHDFNVLLYRPYRDSCHVLGRLEYCEYTI
jgi:hypothetical protein